jgi:hypothetical protein
MAYQSSLKLGIICNLCKQRFSDDDIEMIMNVSQNIRMWHKVLTHGITPKEFLKELSAFSEQVL